MHYDVLYHLVGHAFNVFTAAVQIHTLVSHETENLKK